MDRIITKPPVPIPEPSYLDNFEFFRMVDGRKVWSNPDKSRFYTWDSLHGEIEVFNKRGRHLGALDALSGVLVKEETKGRRLNLK
jgi:hypothetical protein